MAISVIFDYAGFALRFPECAALGTVEQIMNLAADAALKVPLSRIRDATLQMYVWFLATAHMAQIRLQTSSGPASQGLAGRVTSASEGSVSMSLDVGPVNGAVEAWWQGTKYGSELWALTAYLRRFRYLRGYRRVYPLLNSAP